MPTEEIQKITFKKLIMTVGNLPSSYVESLSYYECMLWLCDYLQNTVVPAVNNNGEAVEELQGLYVQLKNYVDNYFDNLDLQEEVNTKLDEMAEDGTITNLIKEYIDPLFDEYKNGINEEISRQNEQINDIESLVTSATSGSPKGVYATVSALTTADPDHDYIYLVTDDGKWYYYSSGNWVAGGVYQATGIQDSSITIPMLSDDILDNIAYYKDTERVLTPNYYLNVVNQSTLEPRDNTNYKYETLSVNTDDIIKIKTYLPSNATIYALLMLFNDTLVDYTMLGTDYDFDDVYTYRVPATVNKIIVQSTTPTVTSVTKLSIYDVGEMQEDINDLTDEFNVKKVYTDITADLSITNGRFYNTTSNSYQTWVNAKYGTYPCTEGTKFKITSKLNSNMCGVAYFTEDSELISYEPIIEEMTYLTEYESTAPANTYYAVFDTNIADGYVSFKVEKEVNTYVSIEELLNKDYSQDYDIENLQRRCTNLEKINPFEWGTFDKSYFAFVIDDCNSFTPTCYDLFHSLNVPLCSACITSTLGTIYTTANGRSIKQVLQEMVNDGGEVLAHYTGNLAPAGTPDTQQYHYLTTPKDWIQRTRDVKKTLNDYGFDVRGIITADHTIPNTSTGQYYCSLYFDYSDTLGTSPNFNLGRRKFFIGVDTLQDMKDYIDTCCETPGFYPFCLHGNRVDEPLANVSDLTSIINYILAKGNSVAEISTYSYVFDNFGSTKLENIVNNL